MSKHKMPRKTSCFWGFSVVCEQKMERAIYDKQNVEIILWTEKQPLQFPKVARIWLHFYYNGYIYNYFFYEIISEEPSQ